MTPLAGLAFRSSAINPGMKILMTFSPAAKQVADHPHYPEADNQGEDDWNNVKKDYMQSQKSDHQCDRKKRRRADIAPQLFHFSPSKISLGL